MNADLTVIIFLVMVILFLIYPSLKISEYAEKNGVNGHFWFGLIYTPIVQALVVMIQIQGEIKKVENKNGNTEVKKEDIKKIKNGIFEVEFSPETKLGVRIVESLNRNGVILDHIENNSCFRENGAVKGDKILRVNGIFTNDIKKFVNTIDKMKKEKIDKLEIEIETK